jgi:hypothetical protein
VVVLLQLMLLLLLLLLLLRWWGWLRAYDVDDGVCFRSTATAMSVPIQSFKLVPLQYVVAEQVNHQSIRGREGVATAALSCSTIHLSSKLLPSGLTPEIETRQANRIAAEKRIEFSAALALLMLPQ